MFANRPSQHPFELDGAQTARALHQVQLERHLCVRRKARPHVGIDQVSAPALLWRARLEDDVVTIADRN
jgi:hypothetical protein